MPEKRFIGIKEYSQYLDIPTGTLYAWTHLKKIPYHKFGKAVKFDLKDLGVWIKRKRVKPLWKIEI